jgi:hypothetical protein
MCPCLTLIQGSACGSTPVEKTDVRLTMMGRRRLKIVPCVHRLPRRKKERRRSKRRRQGKNGEVEEGRRRIRKRRGRRSRRRRKRQRGKEG